MATMALVAATAVLNISVQPASAAPAIAGSIGGRDSTALGRTVTFTGSVTNTGTVAGTDDFTSVTMANDVTDLGGGTPPAGSLATTGGDPLALTVAGTVCLLLGFILVQASRRRRTIPRLARARHLRT